MMSGLIKRCVLCPFIFFTPYATVEDDARQQHSAMVTHMGASYGTLGQPGGLLLLKDNNPRPSPKISPTHNPSR